MRARVPVALQEAMQEQLEEMVDSHRRDQSLLELLEATIPPGVRDGVAADDYVFQSIPRPEEESSTP